MTGWLAGCRTVYPLAYTSVTRVQISKNFISSNEREGTKNVFVLPKISSKSNNAKKISMPSSLNKSEDDGTVSYAAKENRKAQEIMMYVNERRIRG